MSTTYFSYQILCEFVVLRCSCFVIKRSHFVWRECGGVFFSPLGLILIGVQEGIVLVRCVQHASLGKAAMFETVKHRSVVKGLGVA